MSKINITGKTEKDIFTPKDKSVEIRHLLNDKDKYDTDIPCQRSAGAWSLKMNQQLVQSLVAGRPISAIHVNEIKGGDAGRFRVIDGKQRLSAIFRFFDNAFKVYYTDSLGKERGPTKYSTMKDQAKNGDTVCKNILDTINSYSVHFARYENLSLDDETELFELLNRTVPLAENELQFSKSHNFAGLLSYVLKKEMSEVSFLMQKNIFDNKKSAGSRFLSDLLVACFGPRLDDHFMCRSIKLATYRDFSNWMQDRIKNEGFGIYSSRDIVDATLEMSKIDRTAKIDGEKARKYKEICSYFLGKKNLEKIKEACQILAIIFNGARHLNKGVNSSFLFDMLCWIVEKLQDGIFTKSFCELEKTALKEIFMGYKLWKKSEEGKNTNQGGLTKKQNVKMRMQKLDDLLLKSGLDMGKKGKPISNADKDLAVLSSTGIDPKSGKILGADAHFGHNQPSSIYSDAKGITMEDPATNIRAGNVDIPFAHKIIDSMKSASAPDLVKV